jgi:hypothetical protein
MTSITIPSGTYNLVSLPTSPGPAEITLGMTDAIATVDSPYVPSQSQTQQWPGADGWDAQWTLPPLSDAQAADWEGFLAELRGKLNVFQIGDPRRKHPLGVAGGVPVVGSGNTINSASLVTAGWHASVARILLRGDMLQVGYRLYRVTETVSSDGSGNCTIPVWPVLREAHAGGTSIVLNAPVGLFRLSDNRRQSIASKQRLTSVNFKATEVR